MRISIKSLFYLTLSLFVTGIASAQPRQSPTLKLIINPAETYQTIEHFGASDAWSCQFVGQWPDSKKNAIADLLFSQDTLQNGQPVGIGLSLWRFNIGAGSSEQGENSDIKDEWRRAESFLNADGTYNWNKQAGQSWFLKAAQSRGVSQFLAFPNSPPVFMTKNKKGYASKDGANKGIPNLAEDRFDDYATYLAEVLAGLHGKTGVDFDYISPVNEPQWDWTNAGQEGTPYRNGEIAGITKALSNILIQKGIKTKIDIAEAGQIDFLYADHNKAGQGQQVQAFFDPKSKDYVGDLPNLSKGISAHSYFTTSPAAVAISKRKKVAEAIGTVPGLRYWMSEYCILGNNAGDINGNKKDLGIDPALYVAGVIHNDLVYAQASAWHWWLAISPYNYKDGLIYIDKNKTDGNFQASKMLWALGQYSRFIKPGAQRIAVQSSQESELLVSAYMNEAKEIVTVLVNPTENDKVVNLSTKEGDLEPYRAFKTSAQHDLRPIDAGPSLTISAKSIVTVIAKIPSP
ncbi:O-glycosyl hydrolase [Dyadobacter jejuensis]|uniref:O-glycosyl hydrolase n=1 Tax=Dyadobacter jejuensis TaxID=1082580 RepID=A0A316AD39_9BACT|nr:glycoside hydrolase family 30 protein [Dyadobacter jejuensis]PWJ55551.1 O-glycosyl hydrolase [Dyadobacter jejuensis]